MSSAQILARPPFLNTAIQAVMAAVWTVVTLTWPITRLILKFAIVLQTIKSLMTGDWTMAIALVGGYAATWAFITNYRPRR